MPVSGKIRLRGIILFVLLSVTFLALAGACYQALAFRADTRRFPRFGHLVDAGQFQLNVYCTGKGSPTIVLESGLADALDAWIRVQPEIAKFARVCSYDRAGYGYSEPGPMPRTSDRIASELHSALRSAGEKAPYVLVGSSFGGYNVRVFNGKYPDEIAGLVLADATQEDQYHLLPKAWADLGAAMRQRALRRAFWAPIYIDLGLARLQFQLQGQRVAPVLLQSKYIQARTSELWNIEVSAEQARRANHISEKPLLVLTAGRPVDSILKAALSEADCRAYQETWINDLQLRLTRLSVRGRRVIVPDSGHDIAGERPDASVSAVRDLWASLKH